MCDILSCYCAEEEAVKEWKTISRKRKSSALDNRRMFRAFGGNGAPPTHTPPVTQNGSHHHHHQEQQQSDNGKDTSSLFFNQIEDNLRSWNSTNYCLSSPPPPTATANPPRAPGHGSVGSGNVFLDNHRYQSPSQQPPQSHNQQSYDNVLRMMMSTAQIGLTKATNQTRSNGNLFNKFYGRMYYSLCRTPIKCLSFDDDGRTDYQSLVLPLTGLVPFPGDVYHSLCHNLHLFRNREILIKYLRSAWRDVSMATIQDSNRRD